MTQVYSIYQIVNKVNGKVYIGWTHHNPPIKRWKKHIEAAKDNCPYIFHRAIRKYGAENFSFEVLCQSKNGEYIKNEMEPYFIKLHESFGIKGYNMTLGGEGSVGFKHTEESKEKIRRSRLGTTHKSPTQKTRKLMSKNQKEYWKKNKRNTKDNRHWSFEKENGEIIEHYGSLTSFAKQYKCHTGNLSSLFHGKLKSCSDIIKVKCLEIAP